MKRHIALLLTAAITTDLHAQRLADAVAGYAALAAATIEAPGASVATGFQREPPTTSMIVTGTLFAAGGVMAGAVVGAELEHCSHQSEYCGFGGAVLGGLVGEILMLPLGVHISSDRSSLGTKVKASWAATLASAVLAGPTMGASIALLPAGQLFATILVEKRALRRASPSP